MATAHGRCRRRKPPRDAPPVEAPMTRPPNKIDRRRRSATRAPRARPRAPHEHRRTDGDAHDDERERRDDAGIAPTDRADDGHLHPDKPPGCIELCCVLSARCHSSTTGRRGHARRTARSVPADRHARWTRLAEMPAQKILGRWGGSVALVELLSGEHNLPVENHQTDKPKRATLLG